MATATLDLDREARIAAHSERIAREMGLHNVDGNYERHPLAPVPPQREFRSAPKAKPMRPHDINNVQFLNLETARDILHEVAKVAPHLAAKAIAHVEAAYRDLLTERERVVLAGMAARKFAREAKTA